MLESLIGVADCIPNLNPPAVDVPFEKDEDCKVVPLFPNLNPPLTVADNVNSRNMRIDFKRAEATE